MDNFAARNLKEFLQLFNNITEKCFLHCVNRLGQRDLSQDESRCVDVCSKKFVNVNSKVMQVYMEVQSQVVNRKLEEMKQGDKAVAKPEENNEASNSKELNVKSAVAT